MVDAEKSFIQHAGYVLFPRTPNDLTSTTQCPACFATLTGTSCTNCQLDLAHPAAAELATTSTDAAAALERRLELIGRIRSETAAAPAAVVAPAPPAPHADPVALPRRHSGVQVILLVGGVSLLAVGAIFFLVYAFITFGLVWRSVIIGTVTIVALAAATVLKRRGLGGTAEAIAGLAVVFVYLDAFALRANDLFGLGSADALIYWGVALVLSSVGFAAWHRASGLRLPNIAAFSAVAPGVALLVAGLSEPLEDATRLFAAFLGLAVGGLVHPLARRSGTWTGQPERVIVLSLTLLALVGAALASLAISLESDWAPAPALGLVALVALAHTVAASRTPVPQGFTVAIAAAGVVAAGVAVLVVGLRIGESEFIVVWPPIAAAALALGLEFVARRSPAGLRAASEGAAWAGAAVAGLTLLIPIGTSLGAALTIAAEGASRWTVNGGATHPALPEQAIAVLGLVAVVVLASLAWGISKRLVARRGAITCAAGAVLIVAVPLIEVLWAIVAVWLLLAALGTAVLIAGRARAWSRAIRVPVAVIAAASLLLAYASSWASIDTWWYGSVGAVVVLVLARVAVRAPAARAALLGSATILALVAVWAEGWHINERFAAGTGAATDAAHAVTLLSVILVGLSALAGRAITAIEARTLYWISLAAAIGGVAVSRYRTEVADSGALVFPEFATSLVLAAGLVAALLVWLSRRSTTGFRIERAAASVAVAFAVAWLADSLARVLLLPDFSRTIAVLLALCALHVASIRVARAPLPRLTGWTSIVLAALTGAAAVARDVLDPLEWASVPIAAALLVGGALELRRMPAAGSWRWLAPGILVLLIPSLVATFAEPPVWRLVALGLASIALVVVGALGRLQAPLILGSVVVLVHALRTFAPQLLLVYQATEWWVWAVVGGAVILFLGFTFEKRVRDLKSVGSRISALR